MVACVVTGQLCLLPHAAPSTLTATPRHQWLSSVRALRVHPSLMSASRQGKWSMAGGEHLLPPFTPPMGSDMLLSLMTAGWVGHGG